MITARTKTLFPLALALLASCGPLRDATELPHEATAEGGTAPEVTLNALALEAIDPDPAVADRAIDALRAAGPSGLTAMLETHADLITRLRTLPLTADRDALDGLRDDPTLDRLRAAIDRVAAQRDAFASGLYWYTDIHEARAEAARSGRPILSLRLLGRLDEEASCANSRFFRWLLYPSPLVQQALEGYVLHWSSERPAPHITIDMGDGRTIERTITGNSIHYVLDASGNVIDAIAGLHGADDFAERLRQAHGIAERCGMRAADRACLATEHRNALETTARQWATIQAGTDLPSWEQLIAMDTPAPSEPLAVIAMPISIGKMSIEQPMLRLMGAAPAVQPPPPVPWAQVATISTPVAYQDVLSEPSRALARLKTGRIDDALLLRGTFDRVARDTVQNRFTLDRRLHAWLADASVGNDLASINTRVYAELFLTPASDPWLGLQDESTWDVLEVTTSSGTAN